MRRPFLWVAPLLLTATACSSGSVGQQNVPANAAPQANSAGLTHVGKPPAKLRHIIVVIQENRSVDDLFNGFCVAPSVCADTVTVDPVSGTPLQAVSLANPASPNHSHNDFVREFDNGAMDGFSKEKVPNCYASQPCTLFAYVPPNENALYRQMATNYGVFSDATFETLQGPSLPAHLYAIAGQSGGYNYDHNAIDGGSGSCATQDNVAPQIQMQSSYPGAAGPTVPPCKDFPTIFDLVTNAGHSWKYYAHATSGFLEAPQNIQHLFNSQNFIVPEKQVLTDIANGQLADVSFVTPVGGNSDHPGWVSDPLAGGAWVASIVNAIGETPYWNNTVVLVWWDDWGGWFDHVKPQFGPGPYWLGNPNPLEQGFRVPFMLISAYAKVGRIDHTPRTFVSALRLIEKTFQLPSLSTTDQYEPDALDSFYDITQPPIPFVPIGGSKAAPFRHPTR